MSDPKEGLEKQRPESAGVSELHGPILRERSDPREGYEPVPMWFTALCGILVFWAGWYMSEYGGGGQADVLDPRPVARFPDRGDGGPQAVDPVVLGKKLYTANCVSCHQQSGLGVPGQYPTLVGSKWVVGNAAIPKRILLHGLKGKITVKGETYNGNMPAFGERLNDEYLGAILTYIRSAWGNEASAVPAASVAETRAATKDKRGEWLAAELEGLTADDWTPPPPTEEDKEK